jgi:hypothetical protein
MRFPLSVRGVVLSTIPLAALALCLSGSPRAYGDEPPSDPSGGDEPAGMGDAPAGMGDGGKGDGGKDDGADPNNPDNENVPFSKEVNNAIAKGVQWLTKRQGADGSWGALQPGTIYGNKAGQPYLHPAGLTGLSLYALLKCDVPPDAPPIKKGFAWLQKTYPRPYGSYETSVCLLAVCATADPIKKTAVAEANKEKIRARLTGPMRKWAQDLVDSLVKKHTGQKGWRYQVVEGNGKPRNDENNGSEDISSTQLAALALFAADRCGVTAPAALWKDILSFAMAQQEDDGPEVTRWAPTPDAAPAPAGDPNYAPQKTGVTKDHARGFSYMKSSPDAEEHTPRGTTTVCGMGSILISRFLLEMRKDAGWKKNGYDKRVQQAVYDGLAWMDLHWSPFENPGPGWYETYWLYGIERTMDLVGLRLIGKHPWYEEGAKQLIGRQMPDGQWDMKTHHQPCNVIDTSFALLFLKKSTKGAIPFPAITGGSDEGPADNRGK